MSLASLKTGASGTCFGPKRQSEASEASGCVVACGTGLEGHTRLSLLLCCIEDRRREQGPFLDCEKEGVSPNTVDRAHGAEGVSVGCREPHF